MPILAQEGRRGKAFQGHGVLGFSMKRLGERRFRILRVNTTSGQHSKSPIKMTGLPRHLLMKRFEASFPKRFTLKRLIS
jgi:hypothetical protein